MSDKQRPDSNQDPLLLDHDYDGIQELDHPLPRWWLWLFYATILFSGWYVGYYMLGHGPSPTDELVSAMKDFEAAKPKDGGSAVNLEALALAAQDPGKLKHGGEVYSGRCQVCHGDKGQGLIGPNLTDEYWLHGKGSLEDIATVVSKGVPDKGMPPWAESLNATEICDVVAYVHSLRGTNPPNPKAPQGEKQEIKN